MVLDGFIQDFHQGTSVFSATLPLVLLMHLLLDKIHTNLSVSLFQSYHILAFNHPPPHPIHPSSYQWYPVQNPFPKLNGSMGRGSTYQASTP
mmetsp:Transcript_24465/g.52896  ORF Transcript_24465/g.52896 Transcript_24465/m.52896 type:complete len:92 (-) Transcript_24465:1003-1278(-)